MLLLIHRIIVKNCFTRPPAIALWTAPELSVPRSSISSWRPMWTCAIPPRRCCGDLHCDIDRLFALDVAADSDAESLQGLEELERAIRRLPAARSVRVADVASRGLAGQRGCRSDAALLRQLLNCSAAEAGSQLGLADDLVPGRSLSTGELLPPKLPALAAAVAAGEVSAEQVRLIRQTMRRIPNTVDQPTREKAERDLVEHARTLDPDQLRHACARLLMCLDPGRVPGLHRG